MSTGLKDPRTGILVTEITEMLDNAIDLIDRLGKKDLSLQLHNVAVELDLYMRDNITAQSMTRYDELDNVINMFASRQK